MHIVVLHMRDRLFIRIIGSYLISFFLQILCDQIVDRLLIFYNTDYFFHRHHLNFLLAVSCQTSFLL